MDGPVFSFFKSLSFLLSRVLFVDLRLTWNSFQSGAVPLDAPENVSSSLGLFWVLTDSQRGPQGVGRKSGDRWCSSTNPTGDREESHTVPESVIRTKFG